MLINYKELYGIPLSSEDEYHTDSDNLKNMNSMMNMNYEL